MRKVEAEPHFLWCKTLSQVRQSLGAAKQGGEARKLGPEISPSGLGPLVERMGDWRLASFECYAQVSSVVLSESAAWESAELSTVVEGTGAPVARFIGQSFVAAKAPGLGRDLETLTPGRSGGALRVGTTRGPGIVKIHS